MIRLSTLTLGLVLAAGAAFAQTGKVTVVTSFSKDVTDPLKKAFEKAVPGATLEVQNRNTNAGVKFLEETKANNQVDLFWASAPDAFEVLKGKKLLSPRIESPTEIMAVVSGNPMERSAAEAFARLILWMEEDYGWNRWQAYDLLTHVARLSIGYYGIGTIAAKVEKRYLTKKASS